MVEVESVFTEDCKELGYCRPNDNYLTQLNLQYEK